MYLTDYREYSLKDVITQLEPELFKKVTGLSVKDFELLVSLNVFNEALMNDAVYKFKRYEDASLIYAGVDRHSNDKGVGLFSTVVSREDYAAMAGLQASSMVAAAPKANDVPDRPYFVNIDVEEEDEPKPVVVAPIWHLVDRFKCTEKFEIDENFEEQNIKYIYCIVETPEGEKIVVE